MKEAEPQVNPAEAQLPQTPLTLEYIAENYSDVLSGLGCLPAEYRIEVDKSIKPVHHQPRRVAVPLKSELKTIEELEQASVS